MCVSTRPTQPVPANWMRHSFDLYSMTPRRVQSKLKFTTPFTSVFGIVTNVAAQPTPNAFEWIECDTIRGIQHTMPVNIYCISLSSFLFARDPRLTFLPHFSLTAMSVLAHRNREICVNCKFRTSFVFSSPRTDTVYVCAFYSNDVCTFLII